MLKILILSGLLSSVVLSSSYYGIENGVFKKGEQIKILKYDINNVLENSHNKVPNFSFKCYGKTLYLKEPEGRRGFTYMLHNWRTNTPYLCSFDKSKNIIKILN